MNSANLLVAPQRWLQSLGRRTLTLGVRVQVFPHPLAIEPSAPVCYVLPRPSLTNSALLDELTRKHDIPKSRAPLNASKSAGVRPERHAVFALHEDRSGVSAQRLTRWVDAVAEGRLPDVQLIPVNIFWGRAPEREEREGSSLRGLRWLRLWAAEGWGGRSRLKNLIAMIFFRRSVVSFVSSYCSFSQLFSTKIKASNRQYNNFFEIRFINFFGFNLHMQNSLNFHFLLQN